MHRVPESWEFPRCGVRDFWRQWWIGDSIRQVSPLRFVKLPDVKHLDKRPIIEEERHGRRGKFKNSRRAARKVLCDMRYLIKFIRKKLEEKNMWFARHEAITQRKVNSKFEAINSEFMVNQRDLQKSWVSVVRQLRAIAGDNDDSSDPGGSTG
jgi:isoleucyl-tRNA synthetase